MRNWLKYLIIFLTVFTLSCKKNYKVGEKIKTVDDIALYHGGEIYNIQIQCHPKCPDINLVKDRMDSVYKMFEPHLREKDRVGSEKYWGEVIYPYYVNEIRFSQWDWHPEGLKVEQIHGAYNPGTSLDLWIDYDYDCGECPNGLCGGIIDYELGHPIMHQTFDYMDEFRWLDYRKQHELFYSENAYETQCATRKE